MFTCLGKIKLSIHVHDVWLFVCMHVCMEIWIEKGAGIVLRLFPFLFLFPVLSFFLTICNILNLEAAICMVNCSRGPAEFDIFLKP